MNPAGRLRCPETPDLWRRCRVGDQDSVRCGQIDRVGVAIRERIWPPGAGFRCVASAREAATALAREPRSGLCLRPLNGAVAQLGERTVRIGEVRGSIPLSSIARHPVPVAGIVFAPHMGMSAAPRFHDLQTRPEASPPRAPGVLGDRLAVAQPQLGSGPYAGIRLTDVVGAMSYALDLTEGQPMGHSVRTTMIGMRIAETLRLPEHDRSALFYALLLKDLGCSSNAAQMSSLYGGDDRALKKAQRLIDWTDHFDMARYAYKYSQRGKSSVLRGWNALRIGARTREVRHAMARMKSERGAAIAGMLAMPKATCDAIRSIDEHWDGNGVPTGLRGDAIPVLARIVCLAQTVEVFEHGFDVNTAYDVAHARRGRWFDPAVVNCLDMFRDDAVFWGELRSADALSALGGYEPEARIVYADELRLDTIAEAFAKVIDAKSPYTARHSQNVAFLATRTAKEVGLPRREVRAIRRAALLHDVGKLGISSSVLDKPSALDRVERAEMRRHTVYTFDILRRVNRFQRFAMLAASHHERLDGSGYHLGLSGDDLDMPVRILMAADVCEALTADRPYRAGMPIGSAMARLDEMVAAGELCPVAVEALTGWFNGLPSSPVEDTEHGDSTSLIDL